MKTEATGGRQEQIRALLEEGAKTKAQLAEATGWDDMTIGNALQALKRAGAVTPPAERGGAWSVGGKGKRATSPPAAPAKTREKRTREAARRASPRPSTAPRAPAKLSAEAPLKDRLIAERAELVAQHEAQLAKFDQLIEVL